MNTQPPVAAGLAESVVAAMGRGTAGAPTCAADLLPLLRPLALPPADSAALAARLASVAALTPRPATRLGFTRAYLRIHANGIREDGRNSSVIVELTTRCNRRCRHCYAAHPAPADLPDATLDSILAYVHAHAKHVCFTGGEPTLDARLIPTAEAHPDIIFFAFSNGAVVDAAFAARLARAPNLVLLLSLDSLEVAQHDAGKGPGSYAEVMRAIDALREAGLPWGFSTVVTNRNAREVLSPAFVRSLRERGAFLGKYVEYIPRAPAGDLDLIPTGETYALMERRKKEIVAAGEIYLQDTEQTKCHGLLFFDVRGRIKSCPFLHYARYTVGDAPIAELSREIARQWQAFSYDGECPLYSDPLGLKRHLEGLGWKALAPDGPLADAQVCGEMRRRYHDFLRLQAAERAHARG